MYIHVTDCLKAEGRKSSLYRSFYPTLDMKSAINAMKTKPEPPPADPVQTSPKELKSRYHFSSYPCLSRLIYSMLDNRGLLLVRTHGQTPSNRASSNSVGSSVPHRLTN